MSSTSTSSRLWDFSLLNFPLRTAGLAFLVGGLSYLVANLGGAFVVRPEMVWPFWPGNVMLLSVLLLTERRMWPLLIVAGLSGFAIYDFQAGLPLRAVSLLVLADGVEIIIAAFSIRYLFEGFPKLNTVRNLAKYSLFVVFLAPASAAFIGALTTNGSYWTGWRVAYLAEALGLLVLMPAIFGLIEHFSSPRVRPRSYYLEAALLFACLSSLGLLTVALHSRTSAPLLVYCVVPFLLWAALRFGTIGVSCSVILVGFVMNWDLLHGRGPLYQMGQANGVLLLQLFLFLTAGPFMVLAVLVEERKNSAIELSEAQRVAKIGNWLLDMTSGAIHWSDEAMRVLGLGSRELQPLRLDLLRRMMPESRNLWNAAIDKGMQEGSIEETDLEIADSEGSIRWVSARGEPVCDITGRITHIRGTIQDITERKRAELGLRESEERFRLLANSAPVLMWMSGPDKLCNFFNQGWLDFTGRTMEEELGDGWVSGVHPNDRNRVMEIYFSAFDARLEFEVEYRLRRNDGKYRWLTDRGVPRFDADGTFVGYIGTAIDITDRKLSEEVLLDMSGRMITAQEEERARVARELHDDVSQQMALLEIGLDELKQEIPSGSTAARKYLRNVAQLAGAVASDLHQMSHKLHPSRLDTLGLVAAVEGLCREISEHHKLEIRFVHQDIPAQIPKDLTLCIFRIVQESLRNVVKHSGASKAKVELIRQFDRIDLFISDQGAGFDAGPEGRISGLGLISMRERLRLVSGQLFIESQPSRGTRIRAHVPLRMPDAAAAEKEKAQGARA